MIINKLGLEALKEVGTNHDMITKQLRLEALKEVGKNGTLEDSTI